MEIIWEKNQIYLGRVVKGRTQTNQRNDDFAPWWSISTNFKKWSQAVCVIRVKGLGDVWRRQLHYLGWGGGRWWHGFILNGCCCLSIQRFQIPVFNFFLPQGAPLGFPKMLYPGIQACKEDYMRYLHAIRLWKTEVWIHCAVYSQIIFRLKLHHCSPYSHHPLILASVSPPVPIYMDPDQS